MLCTCSSCARESAECGDVCDAHVPDIKCPRVIRSKFVQVVQLKTCAFCDKAPACSRLSRASEFGHKAAHAVNRQQETTGEYVFLNKIDVIAVMLITVVWDCDVPKFVQMKFYIS
jgi:hypothetical protein